MNMEFPLKCVPNSSDCTDFLKKILHRENGFKCPNGHDMEECVPHRTNRNYITVYKCKVCGKCFNLFTGTALSGTRHDVTQIILIIDAVNRGKSVSSMARDYNVDRKALAKFILKLKKLNIQDFKSERCQIDWKETLELIEDWQIIQYPEDDEMLVLKIRGGTGLYYSLNKRVVDITDPNIKRKRKVSMTQVKKLSRGETDKLYRPGT